MSVIDPALLDRLANKLGVSKARVYALIQKRSHESHVTRRVGALLLAGDNGISVQKYADEADRAELHGLRHHARGVAPAPLPPELRPPPPPRVATRRKGGRAVKTKENTVFVVHGRDENLRDAMYEFLGALGLKPQEWGHAIRAASRGRGGNPYVGDAVNKIMEQAQAIVVMLSPDDDAKLKEQFVTKQERTTEGKLQGQARPNVIFETGIAIGTHHRKTVMVRVGDVKPFTDIGGMHVPRLSNHDKSRHEFANRLADLGCKIDRSGDHWLRAGDFTPTPPRRKAKRSR